MRGLRGTSVAAVGLCVLLAAGGGYALASGGGGKTITVCVSHHGGALYKAKHCAKHDKKLTWNKQGIQGIQGTQGIQGQRGNTGPQGPGATSLVYNGTGSASPTPTTVGTLGPWTLTAKCTQSGSDTAVEVDFSGAPGFSVDGTATFGETTSAGTSLPGSVFASSATVPGPLSNRVFASTPASADENTASGQFVLFPTGGSPMQLLGTTSSVGSTPPPGATANTCHFSLSVIPVAAPSSAAAALWHGMTTRLQGPLFGKP